MPEIRFHDLRNTAASLMLNNGIPVIVVSRRLGHAQPSITLDVYGHLIPSKQQEAAEKMDELLTPISVEFTTGSPQSGHLAVSKGASHCFFRKSNTITRISATSILRLFQISPVVSLGRHMAHDDLLQSGL